MNSFRPLVYTSAKASTTGLVCRDSGFVHVGISESNRHSASSITAYPGGGWKSSRLGPPSISERTAKNKIEVGRPIPLYVALLSSSRSQPNCGHERCKA